MSTVSKTKTFIQSFFLAFFIFLLFPPLFYQHPIPGVDPSWDIAVHLAFKYHLQFGKDFLFTYGPLTILHGRLPIAVNIFVYILFDLYLLLTSFFVLKDIFKKHFSAGTVIFIFILITTAMYSSPDQWYYFFFLFYVFSFIKNPSKSLHIAQAGLLSLLCFYYKSNLGMIAISIFLIASVYGLVRKKFTLKGFAAILLSYFAAIWLSALALNVNLKGYVRGGTHIIDAYNDAMSIASTLAIFTVAALLIILVIFLWMAYGIVQSCRKKELFKTPDDIFIYGVVALSVFILFKSGFVRGDDGHLNVFYKGIGFLGSILYLYNPKNIERKIALTGCWATLIISYWAVNTIPGTYEPYRRVLNLSLLSVKTGEIKKYVEGVKNYNKDLAASEQLTSAKNELKQIIGNGTVDIVPTEISTIYFNGLHYNPRPVIQSYSAYDAYLDNLNYEKYSSPTAPDYILFTENSIDRRYPFFDESKTKLAILSHYTFIGKINGDLLLRKKAVPRSLIASKEEETVNAKLFEDIPVSKSDDIIYSRILVNYSLWGKIKRLFYQPPHLKIIFTLENNDTKTFRAVQPILAGGVMINKYVESDEEFQQFMQSDGHMNAAIKKIRIEPDGSGKGFSENIKLLITHYKPGEKSAAERISDSLGIATLLAGYNKYAPVRVNAETSRPDSFLFGIDNLRKHSALLQIEGWAFRKNANNEKSTIKIVLKSADNHFELPTLQQNRGDLYIVYNRKDVISMGFSATVSKHLLPPGSYDLGITIEENGGQAKWVNYNTHQQILVTSDYKIEQIDAAKADAVAGSNINYNIESLEDRGVNIAVNGWAVAENTNPQTTITNLLLKNKEKVYRINTDAVKREDIVSRFKNEHLMYAGFTVLVPKDALSNGSYTLGVEKIDTAGKGRTVAFGNKTLKIGMPDLFIPVQIPALPPLKDFYLGIDLFNDGTESVNIDGWALQNTQDPEGSIIKIIFKHDNFIYASETATTLRPDITAAFKNGRRLDNCGFSAKISKKELPKGKYEVGILIGGQDNKQVVKLTGRFIVKE